MNKYKLNNGIKVLEYNLDSLNSLYIAVIVKVGSRNETEEVAGLSHFLEHILFKGTKKYPNPFDLVRTIDIMGAHYNAFTSKDHTCYYMEISKNYFEKTVKILKEMIFNSLFNKEEINKEINVVIEELKKRLDIPDYFINLKLYKLLFDNNSLGRSVGGYEKVISGLNKDIVVDYYKQYYQPNNISILIAGNIPKNSKELIKTHFDIKVEPYKISKNEFKNFKITQDKSRLKVYNNKNNQSNLLIGFPLNFGHNSKKVNILELFSNILGGSMSSILFMEIREKLGLCYTINCGVDIFDDTGLFKINTGCKEENIKKIIIEIKKILNNLITDGISKKNYDDGKNNLINKFMVSIDNLESLGYYYLDKLVYADFDNINDHNDYINNMKNINIKEVNNIIKEVINFDKINIVIVK